MDLRTFRLYVLLMVISLIIGGRGRGLGALAGEDGGSVGGFLLGGGEDHREVEGFFEYFAQSLVFA